MSIANDMIAIADDMMRMFGVPATYTAQGSVLPGVAVTVRCKPRRRVTMESRTMWQMEISVRNNAVTSPSFGDVFEVDGESWKLTQLPMEFMEIAEACGGALWNLTLVRDARPTRK